MTAVFAHLQLRDVCLTVLKPRPAAAAAAPAAPAAPRIGACCTAATAAVKTSKTAAKQNSVLQKIYGRRR